MIVVTGAAGFIGSCLIAGLLENGHSEIIAVDDFSFPKKLKNYSDKNIEIRIDRSQFVDWLTHHHQQVKFIFHLGARTDTAEMDVALFERLNLNYSKAIWQICSAKKIPLVYASSAATYGSGEIGYDDNHDTIPSLVPLNPYGDSKQQFDCWALEQKETPPSWAGLKFFNVYGPNEYHKGRMASVIFHAFNQIKASGQMKLFRSHKEGIANGHQQRDFIYVKDLVNVCLFLMSKNQLSDIFNLGTGEARTFLDLTNNTFRAMGIEPAISYIDTPADIRDNYQYFTQANMAKLRSIGYDTPFTSLEKGIEAYVKDYLTEGRYY